MFPYKSFQIISSSFQTAFLGNYDQIRFFLPDCATAKTELCFSRVSDYVRMWDSLYPRSIPTAGWILINEVTIDSSKPCDGYRLGFVFIQNGGRDEKKNSYHIEWYITE